MKTKTITLAGTAVAAIFASGLVVSAQAATSAAQEKQITRQLNESQMQHPGVVNGKRAGNMQVSQNDTGMSNTGTSSEDVNTEGTDQTDQNQYNDQNNQNTGYTPGANDEGTGSTDQDQNNPDNTGYTPGANTNDEGVNQNNTGYAPGTTINDEGVSNTTDENPGSMDQDENNPENTGYTGTNENNPGAAEPNENNGVENRAAPLTEMRGAVSLSDVPNASAELQNIPIETRSGERVGTVQAVEVDNDGTARAIQADVEGRQVSLDPNNVVYVKDQNALVTDLTRPEIENLPPVSKTY